jgi:hypothetical protein
MRIGRAGVWFSSEDSTGSGYARPLPRPASPLMGLTSLPEVVPASCSASLVSRSPFAVSHRSGPGHGVFLAHRRRVKVEDDRAPPLRGLASPSEYSRAGLPTPSRAWRLPGVPAPSAHADAGAHSPGICLVPVRVRLQGFAPSCRVSSPASFRPVRAGDAHGVLPFEAFPFGGAGTPLGARCPPVVTRTRRTQPKTTCGRLASPTSGPCSPPESVTITRGLVVRPLDAPLGFRRSRAFRASVAPGFPAAPLSGFGFVGSRRVGLASQGLDPLSRCCAPRSEDFGAATLLRFSHLVSVPRASSRSVPGLRRTVPVTSLLPERRSKGRPLSSPGGLAEGMSVPDSGRHPTLDASIRAPQQPCQTLERKRVTRSVPAPCKPLDHGALRFST